MRIRYSTAIFLFAFSFTVLAQNSTDQQSEEPKATDQKASEQKPEPRKYLTPTQRLAGAKTVYMKNVQGGSDIPFDVIQSAIESWARYTIVDSPEKADLIIEVMAPKEDTGAQVTTKSSTDSQGRQQQSSSTTKDFSILLIKMTVFDAHSKVALWSGIERPKNAWKERVRQDSQVECARKLVTAFHDRVEPPAATESTETSPK